MISGCEHPVSAVPGPDGQPMFHRPADADRESRLASILEGVIGCKMVRLGDLSYLDYVMIRYERAVAYVEFMSRNYSYERLMGLGGVFLKGASLERAIVLSRAPLSEKWLGAFFFYDLLDGLYYQEAQTIRGIPTGIVDMARNDRGNGVNIQNLRPYIKWQNLGDDSRKD